MSLLENNPDIALGAPVELPKTMNTMNTNNFFCTKNIITGILILILVFLLINMFCKDYFTNSIKSSKEENNTLNEIDYTNIKLIIVGRMTCPYCKKLKEELDSNNIKYTLIDSTSEEGIKLMKQYQVQGVPLCINQNNNKIALGYMEIKQLKLKLT